MRSPEAIPSSPPEQRAREAAQALDRVLRAEAARWSGGVSRISHALALGDWWLNLCAQPARAAQLAAQAQRGLLGAAAQAASGHLLHEDDGRFQHGGWRQWPAVLWANGQQALEDWWQDATQLRGLQPHHAEVVRFLGRQWLEMVAPSNWGLANPEVLERTQQELGANLLRGHLRALDRWRADHGLAPLQPAATPYQPGVDVAITPGEVVHRNHLVELIQYRPSTRQVQAEPVFIVPSWIMKYYILDLSPHHSMVKWLVDQGHTVFIVSWRNPDASDALLGLEDYLDLGVLDPLAAIARLVPQQPVHAVGYCLGGTLLSVAAAALARPQRVQHAEQLAPLASVSLLAAETDFSEPGELGVLIDEAQVALLEDLMAERGYLTGQQMAESFNYLHAREQVWSRRLRAYWLGQAEVANDLMAWNADVTRMPAVMHSEYLRRCYLRNDLAEGRFPVEGRPVSLADIRWPLFVVATEQDHVSPWRSVYKIHRLCDSDITFVLTNAGHNGGIVSEPGHPHRHHAVQERAAGAPPLDADDWLARARRTEGSWWPTWHRWLLGHGSGITVPARTPEATASLGPAPGTYVHGRSSD